MEKRKKERDERLIKMHVTSVVWLCFYYKLVDLCVCVCVRRLSAPHDGEQFHCSPAAAPIWAVHTFHWKVCNFPGVLFCLLISEGPMPAFCLGPKFPKPDRAFAIAEKICRKTNPNPRHRQSFFRGKHHTRLLLRTMRPRWQPHFRASGPVR